MRDDHGSDEDLYYGLHLGGMYRQLSVEQY